MPASSKTATALKICFAASEASPFAKTGGLADVASALPAELQRRGHDVRLFFPFYSRIVRDEHEFQPVDSIRDVPVEMGPRSYRFNAFTTRLPGTDATAYLIDCPDLYHRDTIYTTDDDEAERFALLSQAAIECCQRLEWAPDLFHCNDWHTALIPLLLRTVYEWDALFEKTKTLVTIHNLGYQGVFASHKLDDLGLGRFGQLFDQDDLRAGRINFLRAGLLYADLVSTVSPTYAREIQTEEFGMGLEGLLRARSSSLVGILNGVDYGEWSPEADPFIPHKFSAREMEGKERNKEYLLDQLGLEPAPEAPVLGIISRLVHHKGFDLCFTVLPELLARRDLRVVVVGSGEARYEEFFSNLQQTFPGRACYHGGYHNELAHVVEAASDMILMPSRYEPCGLNQMFGLRYGTIPIVRKTGGLADSVELVNGKGQGTGFVFEHFGPQALRWAIDAALDLFADREAWRVVVANAMAKNYSWEVQAEHYIELYERLARR
jgi:starch synthase